MEYFENERLGKVFCLSDFFVKNDECDYYIKFLYRYI